MCSSCSSGAKGYWGLLWLSRKVDPLGIMQEMKILWRWPTQPLGPHILAVDCSLLLSAQLCYLLCSASFSSFFCSAQGPSFLRLSPYCGKFRAQALCVGFTPKQTKESSDWYLPTPTETNPQHRVTIEKYAILIMRNRKKTNNGRSRTWCKEKLQGLGNLKNGHRWINGNKRTNKKLVLGKIGNTSWN